jgi:hypothetical protein
MSEGLFANRSPAATSDTGAERARGQAPSRPFAMAGPEAARMLLGLQRAAGNAAVSQLLERRAPPTALRIPIGRASGAPTAPEPATTASFEEEIDERAGEEAAEARASEAVAGGGEPVDPEPPEDDPDQEHSAAERAEEEAEGEGVSVTEAFVPREGGSPPRAEGAGGGSGFVDGGVQGSVPFADADAADLDPGSDEVPHAFVTPEAGSIPWAGGGHGGGPHVMQNCGDIERNVPPVVDSSSSDLTEEAKAWVKPETGILTVERSYVTSPAGDQGNGWWVSPRAAKVLAAHEQAHVEASRAAYELILKPKLDKVDDNVWPKASVAYFAWTAEALVWEKIGVGSWDKAIREFEVRDKDDNENQGRIDVGEKGYVEMVRYRNSGDPAKPEVPVFGGTVDGQFYEHLLVAPGEVVPNLLPLEEEPGALEHHAENDACGPCLALNGKTFDTGNAPPLPVPGCVREGGCRCRTLPAALYTA